MTRTSSARIAGFTFLFYIAVGIASLIVYGRAVRGDGIAAQLASVAAHTGDLRLAIGLTLLCAFSALVLAVTLYGLTRDEDPELAMMVLACRLGEGVVIATDLPEMVRLLWLATGRGGAGAPDGAVGSALGALFLMPGAPIAATFFAVGSLVFSYLLLRGRMIPAWLAWTGVVASALLVLGLPLQVADVLAGPVTGLIWMPMLAFEVPLGFWLMIRGVAPRTAFSPSPERA